MVMSNEYIPTEALRQRVCDLVMSGAAIYIICEILDINDDTLRKYYGKEIKTAKAVAIERMGKTVYTQGLEGDRHSQALYLKTQGASQGWVEKQVIETTNVDDTLELKSKVKELEDKYKRDY
jgi:hypothetical protein